MVRRREGGRDRRRLYVSVALAINQIAREKGKALLVSCGGSSNITGKECTPNTIHWTYDTWALANGTGKALVKSGADTWFFLTANYVFGQRLERDVEAVVRQNGDTVLGKTLHPFPTSDFSSFLLDAQASHAKIIGLANAGADTTNAIEQGTRLGIVQRGQHFAGLLVFLTDVHELGFGKAQGLMLTEAFCWDLNDQTHARGLLALPGVTGAPCRPWRRPACTRRCCTISRRWTRLAPTTGPGSSRR